ncbi:MAG: helix-turn-helix transcriptional regulator [Actinomycetota bacterium]
MDAGGLLKKARRRANLSQRELADRSGLLQPAIARIESGRTVPRLDTLERLLEACGQRLEVHPRPGVGVDRTMIRRLLALSPRERLVLAAEEARNLDKLLAQADKARRSA